MSHLKPSKLLTLIECLEPHELKKLGQWLSVSLEGNQHPFMVLFQMIERASPQFDDPILDKETIFRRLYDQEAYNNKKLNRLLSKFTRQVERFLVIQKVESDQLLANDILRKTLLERRCPQYFEEITLKLIDQLDENPSKSPEDHWLLAQLYQQLHFQPHEHLRFGNNTDYLSKSDAHLDAFYALVKFRNLHEAIAQQTILEGKSSVHISKDLIDYLPKNISLPALQLYQMRLNRPLSWDWGHYMAFREQYYLIFDQLAPSLQRDFLFFCINDTVVLSTQTYDQAFQEMLDHYKFGLDHHLIDQYHQITGITFNNIINLAGHLQDLEFAQQFIEQYAPYLRSDLQGEATIWAQAQLAYMDSCFQTTIDLLYGQSFSDRLFAIQARMVHFKAMFELTLQDQNHLEQFNSFCESTQKFLRRKEFFSKNRNRPYLRFIYYTRKIAFAKYDPNTNQEKLEDCSTAIRNEPNVFGKPWLFKKVDHVKASLTHSKRSYSNKGAASSQI